MKPFEAVDTFLMARYGLALEEVLCAACLQGRGNLVPDGVAEIAARRVHSVAEDDGGRHLAYAGTLRIGGVSYHFHCHVFVDAGGACFLSDVRRFEPVAWEARVAMPV